MKTYEAEKRQLFDWSTGELERIDKKYLSIPQHGLDGAEVVERKEHFQEYNRRLKELKAKYKVD